MTGGPCPRSDGDGAPHLHARYRHVPAEAAMPRRIGPVAWAPVRLPHAAARHGQDADQETYGVNR